MTRCVIDWTTDRVAELRRLVTSGKTYAAIGLELGITKNAAIGKARRMGFDAKQAEPAWVFPGAAHCLWPQGHVGEDGFGFCGERTTGGSYCPDHHRRAHVRITPQAAA